MKIQKDLFAQFLRKASINDHITDGIIKFGKDRMSFMNCTIDNNMFCNCVIDAKYIWDNEVLGNVGIANMKLLRQVVNRFDSEISISLKDNKLILQDGKRTADFSTLDTDYMKVFPDKILGLDYPYNFEIDNNVLSEAITTCNIVSERTKVFTLEVFKSNISITSGDNKDSGNLNRFFIEDNIKGNVGEKQRVLLGEYIVQALAVIDSPIEISIGESRPFKIFENYQNKIQTIIIIAPRVKDE